MKTCEGCPVEFKPRAWNQRFCTPKCGLAAWRRAHPDRKRAQQQRATAKRDPAKHAALERAWRAANPEKARLADSRRMSRRRSRLAGAEIAFTAAQLADRLAVYDGCWICGSPDWDTVDHVKPLSKGGPHMLANLRPACAPCNRQKAAAWPFTPPRKVS